MRRFKVEFKKIDYRHYISLVITGIFLLITFLVFPNAFVRICEAFRDLWNSLAFYFCELFGILHSVTPTVIKPSEVPFTPILGLPASWEEFQVCWTNFWQHFASMENLRAYLNGVVIVLFNIMQILLLVGVPIGIICFILFRKYLKKQNNDYNKDSKPLKTLKRFSANVYLPCKNWVVNYFSFVSERKLYKRLWLCIWLFNFNFFTIIIEFLAFYMLFVVTFRTNLIYFQFYKLLCDLSVMLAFVPWWCWLLFAYWVICKIRERIGYSRLNHFENMNCGFINERSIVLLVCGTMGKKKTTAITDIALSQEAMLRDKALELLLKNDYKFPNFPWINFENTLKYAIKKHCIYNLATTRRFIRKLSLYFAMSYNNKTMQKSIRRHLRKTINYTYKNLCFDYDYQKYGLTYNDNLKVVDLWTVLETYAQLYFVYVIQSSLIISNYSIRSDNNLEYLGNFPLWETDFFERDSQLIDETSNYSHIIDFDALRLGQKIIKDNPQKDSFEFGVVNITEVGKERKNTLELRETKKNEELANQKNDGFDDWLKMVRHSATIDNFPFVKVITDEQRPESWGANARDLTEILHIKETTEPKLAMPFFSITTWLYKFFAKQFEKLYIKYRFFRSDNTVFMHTLKLAFSKLHNYYTKKTNTFSYSELIVDLENGTQDGIRKEKAYYLMSKKIYSKRFSTDAFSEFFASKNINSKVGLEDLDEYKTEKATFEELKKQNSYFVNDLLNKK
ncbi:MAG: hypothetical protein IJA22_01615 [Clostridia bacterium]|nr:hypothetical protein [Clostridia bacterium]